MAPRTAQEAPITAPQWVPVNTAPLGLFLSLALMTSVAYSLLSSGSMGGCAGGVSSSGGYVDSAGNPTTTEPTCLMLQLQPQPYVYLILFGLAVLALSLVRRRQSLALPVKTLTTAAVVAIISVGVLFSGYHFLFVQDLLLGDWRSNHDVIPPFLSNATIDRTTW